MNKFLSDDLYELVTQNVPVVCVDILPVGKRDGKWQLGMILRATGSQAGKQTILGGRVYHSETIDAAIARHLITDLGVTDFSYFQDGGAENPFTVQQYFMENDIQSERYGFDPTKHAVASTYLVVIDETKIKPINEASEFIWVKEQITDPHKTGYNQHVVVNRALNLLTTTS